MHNPRFDLLMLEYSRQGTITLVLAGIVLAAVLTGWFMLEAKTPAWLRYLYFGFLLLAFIFILAGTTFLIMKGGSL
jgi:hypothetical protein